MERPCELVPRCSGVPRVVMDAHSVAVCSPSRCPPPPPPSLLWSSSVNNATDSRLRRYPCCLPSIVDDSVNSSTNLLLLPPSPARPPPARAVVPSSSPTSALALATYAHASADCLGPSRSRLARLLLAKVSAGVTTHTGNSRLQNCRAKKISSLYLCDTVMRRCHSKSRSNVSFLLIFSYFASYLLPLRRPMPLTTKYPHYRPFCASHCAALYSTIYFACSFCVYVYPPRWDSDSSFTCTPVANLDNTSLLTGCLCVHTTHHHRFVISQLVSIHLFLICSLAPMPFYHHFSSPFVLGFSDRMTIALQIEPAFSWTFSFAWQQGRNVFLMRLVPYWHWLEAYSYL